MARSSYALTALPALFFAAACATAVDQGFVNDGDDTGGSQSSPQGGLSSSAGQSPVTAGQVNGGGAGKPAYAFGGTTSGGMTSGGTTSGSAGASSSGQAGTASSSAGAGTGGQSSTGGTSAGAGGKAGGGASGTGGTNTSAGTGGTSGGAGGSGTAGSAGSGMGGTGGSTGSTGECAPAGTGWVVQYWTSTGTANMPAGDVRIFNNAGGSVNFNTLELRHYFTNEETATLSFIFSTFGHNFPGMPYYEDEGGTNVQSSVKNVTPAVTNASQYISVKFNATPGNFGNGENVQLGYYGSLSMYPMKSNQANDYTYVGHPTSDPGSANKNTGWDRITLYAGGKLVWGCEP